MLPFIAIFEPCPLKYPEHIVKKIGMYLKNYSKLKYMTTITIEEKRPDIALGKPVLFYNLLYCI